MVVLKVLALRYGIDILTVLTYVICKKGKKVELESRERNLSKGQCANHWTKDRALNIVGLLI